MPSPRTEVYAQIVPKGLFSTEYLIRIMLPYGPTTMPSDVRATWPEVERSLARALRIARNEGAVELPNQLEDSLAIEMTVPAIVVNHPDSNLLNYLASDIQRTIVAAIKGRDADRRN